MATLIFLILKITHTVALPGGQSDLVVFCQLLGVDTVAVAVILHALISRKKAK